MIRTTAAIMVLLASVTVRFERQTPSAASHPEYLFINSDSGLAKNIVAAGNDGYGIQFVARFPGEPGVILKRDGRGPRSYRVVDTARLSSFVKELNEAGAGGFKLVPLSVKGKSAVLELQPHEARFTYSVVEGEDDGALKALADARGRGLALVGMLGVDMGLKLKRVFLCEAIEGGSSSQASGEREYRIVGTEKTGTLENEIRQAAAAGFRAIMAGGKLAVLMEREAGTAPPLSDYRVIAMRRVGTAVRELQAAGAEGFRIAVVPEHLNEGVFLLHRTPGTSERFGYQIARLKTKTANEQLLQADGEGFRIAVLVNDWVVLERSLTR
jgi:hypothetical protein